MKPEGKIYEPYHQWDTNKSLKGRILKYFGSISKKQACDNLYGGLALSDIFDRFEMTIVNEKERIVDIRVLGHDPRRTIHIRNMSMRQLLVESTFGYVDSKNNGEASWEYLSPQQRVEVCHSELSRWSVKLKSQKREREWGGKRIAPGIKLVNAGWCESIEITNNCTTHTGFELKITVKNPTGQFDQYHGSFIIPQADYLRLSQIQAGAWARQGFNASWDARAGKDHNHGIMSPHSYPKPMSNPTFGMIYWEENFNAREQVTFDLSVYRKIDKRVKAKTYKVAINKGKIDYQRWGKEAEYYTKPHLRRLVINPKRERRCIDPPKKYGEILRKKDGVFKLPVFRSDGLYDVLHPKAKVKKNYPVLKKFNRAAIRKTSAGLHEIQLLNKKPRAKKELHRIVIGNINLNNIPVYPDYYTLHRFGFSPRATSTLYDANWRPASERYRSKKAVYACCLASGPDHQATYVQPESWGIERAILSREGDFLVIDIISYERIVPVWQGKIKYW